MVVMKKSRQLIHLDLHGIRTETKDKHVLTLIVAKSMLHTLIRNSERYLSIDVWTELREEKKYSEAT